MTNEEEKLIKTIISYTQGYLAGCGAEAFDSKNFLNDLKDEIEQGKGFPKGEFHMQLLRDPFINSCELTLRHENENVDNHQFKFKLPNKEES